QKWTPCESTGKGIAAAGSDNQTPGCLKVNTQGPGSPWLRNPQHGSDDFRFPFVGVLTFVSTVVE
ncbi:MAG: hypothetical protein KDA77_23980, partial [Planctomycetaceae bacterium]|nr:hypothetical protein [Planctomycetaceae bacterium]